ncbi:recombinase family protein [[Clostridium] leptum]|nr:recombinase family protein [[Clostridium] leptum]
MNRSYENLPVWLYSRSSDKHPSALFYQMENLLEIAQLQKYTVVGTSQDMSTGKNMARVGLQLAMRSIRNGSSRAILVRDLSRLSQERFVLLKILQFLQDHNAVLITTGSDLRYELYIEGLEEPLIRRAARKNCNVPW